jgi:hypothetical protein
MRMYQVPRKPPEEQLANEARVLPFSFAGGFGDVACFLLGRERLRLVGHVGSADEGEGAIARPANS